MRILVTAGMVYGRLDDNKLVGNRVRGIWAAKFAGWLAERGHQVTLQVADIQQKALKEEAFDPLPYEASVGRIVDRGRGVDNLTVVSQDGFEAYKEFCYAIAPQVDAAVMAAAVVNWIPESPYKGKMPTVGFGTKHADGVIRTMIPFYLAPRVIDGMKERNQKLTLIACKMTIGESYEYLIEQGYKTLLGSRANAVIANDQKDIRNKYIIHQDRVVVPFNVAQAGFYEHLLGIMKDEHFTTEFVAPLATELPCPANVKRRFDSIVDKYRARFSRRLVDADFVFGSLALPFKDGTANGWSALVSPREKGNLFTADDATVVRTVQVGTLGINFDHKVIVTGQHKATLNAPLLLRHLGRFHHEDGSGIHGVLHLHEQIPDVPTVEYAPPGTARDNLREIPAVTYNIAGHGCIAGLDINGEIVK